MCTHWGSPQLKMSLWAAGILAQPSASLGISLCLTIPSSSALLSSESHALARTCRARTVTTTLGRRNYTRAHTSCFAITACFFASEASSRAASICVCICVCICVNSSRSLVCSSLAEVTALVRAPKAAKIASKALGYGMSGCGIHASSSTNASKGLCDLLRGRYVHKSMSGITS